MHQRDMHQRNKTRKVISRYMLIPAHPANVTDIFFAPTGGRMAIPHRNPPKKPPASPAKLIQSPKLDKRKKKHMTRIMQQSWSRISARTVPCRQRTPPASHRSWRRRQLRCRGRLQLWPPAHSLRRTLSLPEMAETNSTLTT